jgi:hypothetical protein
MSGESASLQLRRSQNGNHAGCRPRCIRFDGTQNDRRMMSTSRGKGPECWRAARMLASAMPVESFKHLSHDDALAIAAYLKTLPAIRNKAPGPFGPNEKPASFVYQVLPPDKYAPTPPPSGPHPGAPSR